MSFSSLVLSVSERGVPVNRNHASVVKYKKLYKNKHIFILIIYNYNIYFYIIDIILSII